MLGDQSAAQRSSSAQAEKIVKRSRLALIAATLIAVLLAASAAQADRIALQRTAGISGGAVTLGDIAELSGEHAEQLADVKIAELAEGQDERTLSLSRVRRRLDERGVHWGRLNLSGALKVRVHRGSNPGPVASSGRTASNGRGSAAGTGSIASTSANGGAEANPLAAVSVGSGATPGGLTLRRQVVRFIREQTGAAEDELRITFRDPDNPLLETNIQQARFEIQPLTSRPVGRVPIAVRRYQNGEPTDTHRLRVRVELRRSAVVAARSIGRGQTITQGDVRTRQVWLDSDPDRLVRDASEILGQRASGLMRSGDLIEADDVEPPLLVERGQMVIVRCISGGLVVRTVARAREDGHQGQSIELRNERTRETFRAQVTGPKEAVLKADPDDRATSRTPNRKQTEREDAS